VISPSARCPLFEIACSFLNVSRRTLCMRPERSEIPRLQF
jgi:hypothetical protein